MSDNTRIKRLNVSHYGPISDVDLELGSGLNAFYGKNESGKTLLVESITKMLLDDSSKFKGIGRVPQQPNGLLTVERGGREFDAAQEDIEEIFGDVSAEDVKNALVVRDFDLRLPERDNDFGNGEYFKDVTDRVLGSKTNKIQALRGEISDIGLLTNDTSNSKLTDRKNDDKLRSRREDAKKLKQDIEEFLDELEQEGLFQKYARIDELEKKIDSKEKEINELEHARKQKKYDEGRELLEELRDAEQELEKLEREKESLQDLEEIKERAERFERDAERPGILKWSAAGSSTLSGLSLVAAALNPNPVFAVTAVVFLLAAGYSVYRYRSSSKEVRKKESEKHYRGR
ncbi:MAG: ATP-binding protein [Candidatus Nanohalobium sp.]